jgi:two-component system, OmpR family, alkaline phosphatase synthesis response regulator PhoP
MATSRILIVDDDQDIRKLLGHRLKLDGFEPIFAGDAISAVNQARHERPDLILLDLMLPAGDGYLVMERLKAMPALEGVPVIVVSARDPATEQDRSSELGVDAFFRKPFDYSELLLAIRRALGHDA